MVDWGDEDCHRLAGAGLVLVVIGISTRKATKFKGICRGACDMLPTHRDELKSALGQVIQ